MLENELQIVLEINQVTLDNQNICALKVICPDYDIMAHLIHQYLQLSNY